MKNLLLISILITSITSFSQDIVGKWKTINDERNEESSIVEIYKVNDIYNAKIIAILNKENAKVCKSCVGKYHNKSLKELVIAKELKKDDELYNGKIIDPENAKTYSCYMKLENKNKLKIRGYIGFSILGRTQYWYRIDADEEKRLINGFKS